MKKSNEELAIDVGLDMLNMIVSILKAEFSFEDEDIGLFLSSLDDMVDDAIVGGYDDGYDKE